MWYIFKIIVNIWDYGLIKKRGLKYNLCKEVIWNVKCFGSYL